MRLFFLVVLLLLSTAAKTDCLNPEDILTEKVEDNIHANSSKNNSSCANGWVKSSILLSDTKLAITIKDNQVSLCAKSADNVEHESIDVVLGAVDPPCIIQGLDFIRNDSVKFSLLPAYEREITSDICSGNNANIKVLDENVCRDKFLGKTFISNIRRGEKPVKTNSYNRSYCHSVGENRESNLADLNNSSSSIRDWQDSPLLVIDSNTKSGAIPTILKGYEDANSYSMSDDALQNELWAAVCRGVTPQYLSQKELDNKNSYIQKMRDSLDINTINKKCHNICHLQYDEKGSVTSKVSSDCLFELQNELQSDGSYLSYLPGTSGKEISQSGSGASFTTFGSDFPSGLQMEYEYQLSSDVPQVKIDIVRGQKGAYNLRVFRGCAYRSKRSLYYYVGDSSCPSVKPGDSGTHPIEMLNGNDYINQKVFVTDPSWDGKTLYFGVIDSNNGKDYHSGFFNATARIPKDQKAIFANAVNWVIKHVNYVLYGEKGSSSNIGVVRTIYNKLVYGGDFVNAVRALLILYIAVYGLLYMVGMIRSAQLEVLVVLIKISIILILISPQSWKFFDDNFFQLFTKGNIELINIMSFNDKKEVNFQFIDKSLARFAETQTWLQILAVIFTGPAGFICAFIVVWGVWTLFVAILRAIIIFLISIVVVALLLCVSPIFISFLLFKRTRMVFDNWIKILLQTIMQPVMVFAAIVMLNEIMMSVTYSLLDFGLCYQCFLDVSLGDGVAEFCLMNAYMPATYQAGSTFNYLMKQTYDTGLFLGVPMRIQSIISFVVLCHATSKFVDQVPTMVSSIFGAIGVELDAPAQGVEDTLRSVVGQDNQSLDRRAQANYHKRISPDSNKEPDARTKAKPGAGK